MSEERVISFEVAKYLRGKGFFERCENYYTIEENGFPKGVLNHVHVGIPAPTQTQLQKWLRECHKISVEVNYHTFAVARCNGWYYGFMDLKRQARIGLRENGKTLFDGFESYEAALEAGLKVGLSLIIVQKRYRCTLCGRDKFKRKTPHRCNGQYRKHHIIWEEISNPE